MRGFPLIRTIRPASAQARLSLVCFPHAGGSPFFGRGWSGLPDWIEVMALVMPGPADREAASFRRVEMVVTRLVDNDPSLAGGPYALFGHSLGALVAFELARELRRRGRALPRALLASACEAPQVRKAPRPIHELPDAEFLRELEQLNGTPPEILGDRELMRVLMPRLRADFEMSAAYRYVAEPALACPICVYGGTEDPEVPLAELDAWRAQTSGGFRHASVRGGHFFHQTHPRELSEQIALALTGTPWPV
jgi:medium-chain acyl-[acyl-carrier-protein] hydrolase